MGIVTIPPGETRAGFIYTSLDEGTKAFNVDLVSDQKQAYQFTFFVPVPGLRIDHRNVDWDNLYADEELLLMEDAGVQLYLIRRDFTRLHHSLYATVCGFG
jgi:hypothetical protein